MTAQSGSMADIKRENFGKCPLQNTGNDVSIITDLSLYHMIFPSEEILESEALAIFKCCPNLSLVCLGTQTLEDCKVSLTTALSMYKVYATIIISFSTTKNLNKNII